MGMLRELSSPRLACFRGGVVDEFGLLEHADRVKRSSG